MNSSSPFNRSSVYLEVIEGLSKNAMISEGDLEGIAKEICYRGAHFLKVDRVNIWIINEDETELNCINAYNRSTDSFYTERPLQADLFPIYFNHVRRSELIISENVYNEPFNAELVDTYLKPNAIQSMMEIPILSGGKFRGIVCFEQIESPHSWVSHEQHFALALAQLLTITLEINEKNQYREQLEKALKEKSTFITEINHRVKNNLSVIIALIKAEGLKAKDPFHSDLFQTVLSQVFTLSTVQHSLYDSKSFNQLELNTFIPQLVSNINSIYGHHLKVEIHLSIENITIHADSSIPLSLILNELLTNAFKYAFQENKKNELWIEMKRKNEQYCSLLVRDNGFGLPENYQTKGTGFELISDLLDQIDATPNITSDENGTKIQVLFPCELVNRFKQ